MREQGERAAGMAKRVGGLAAIVILAGAAGTSGQGQARAARGASPAEQAAWEKGRAVFKAHCELCHYDSSEAKKIGPGLKGIYGRGTFSNGKKVDDAGMMRWIEQGGKDMPPMKEKLTGEELRALVSYLKTI